MKISEIENLTMLSEFLCVDEQKLTEFLSTKDLRVYCTKMAIPKKNPRLGYRIVYKVNNGILKNLHKVLQKHLNVLYNAPDTVHGFVPTCNTQTNARCHLAKKRILNIDIEDFFGSVRAIDIAGMLEGLGCISKVATWISELTAIDGKLVQGFITSPVLANMVFKDTDILLEALSRRYQSTYTRYADDITISSDNELPTMDEVESIFASTPFKLNNAKTKIMYRGGKQFVTGLTVFDCNYPRIPKQFKKLIRLRLYFLKKYGCKSYVIRETGISEVEAECDPGKAQILFKRMTRLPHEIKGWIDYVNSIEPSLARKYYGIYNTINWYS
jgi:RNA-directed DNA polymerase